MVDPIGGRPRVCVLGRLRVELPNGREIIPQADTPRALLLLLVLQGGTVHLEQASEALWPEADIHIGRRRLRNALARLRASCDGVPLVAREGQALVLHADTDLAELEGALVTALRLADVGLAPDARYADWAEATHQRLERLRELLAQL